MSGPVTTEDAPPFPTGANGSGKVAVEIVPGREAQVGSVTVHRVLPRKARRMVGAWCFADHMVPTPVTEDRGVEIGPHPHMGLQTVTWLLSGEIVHRDSLGSEQLIRPGQLNLMTAGHGVAHAEESTGRFRGDLQGVQLWVAQPEATRNSAPAFEHHADLPGSEVEGTTVTVIVGEFGASLSPARRDTDHVGVELDLLPPGVTLPLRRDYEYALVVLEGGVTIDDRRAEPGVLAYLGSGRDEQLLSVQAPACALLLGGVPFGEQILMWWNFVGRTTEELSAARAQWSADDGRFGEVSSGLARIGVGPPPWESGPA